MENKKINLNLASLENKSGIVIKNIFSRQAKKDGWTCDERIEMLKLLDETKTMEQLLKIISIYCN